MDQTSQSKNNQSENKSFASVPPVPITQINDNNLAINMNTQHSGQQFKLSTNEVQGHKPPLVGGHGSKFALIAVISILIIFAGIGGYYIYSKGGNPEPTNSPVAAIPSPTPITDKNSDSDKDGLPDLIEKILGTYMTKADTDGDGYNDLAEIKNGYSPLIAGDAGKYSPQEWDLIKGKIKLEDREFYEKEFGTLAVSPSPSSSPEVSLAPSPIVSLNEDFSSPDATFKIYISAMETKNTDQYLKTLDKKTLEKLKNDSAFSESINMGKWDMVQIATWKNANYKIFEQTSNYVIMAPEFREQINSASEIVPVAMTTMPDMYFHVEDNLWKIDFVTTLQDFMARLLASARAKALAVVKGTDINSFEINLAKENAVKQLKEDWKAGLK